MGDHLPVDEIEYRLDFTPTYFGRREEYVRGNPRYRKHPSNIWVWRYPASTAMPFEGQIEGLLEVLDPKIAALKELLSIQGIEGELFLGFGSGNGQGGATLSSDLLKRIGECDLSLSLDLYPPSGDEE
jgi:hypothetical protein